VTNEAGPGQPADAPDALGVAGVEAGLSQPRARRRFGRSRPSTVDERSGSAESIASLHAEVLLLREENARLKAAQHQRADINRLLDRARSLSSAELDRDSLSDEAAQMLIDGLVVRESLLEICQEIERSMVAFEAKLNALASAAADRGRAAAASGETDAVNRRAPQGRRQRAPRTTKQTNGRGPTGA
jgi:hypothetical protein